MIVIEYFYIVALILLLKLNIRILIVTVIWLSVSLSRKKKKSNSSKNGLSFEPFSNLRRNLVANKCQLCVRTAWPGNKTSIVSNWQNFLPSAVAAANQRPAWWNRARSPWQPLHSTSAHWYSSHRPLRLRQMAKITPTGEVKLAVPCCSGWGKVSPNRGGGCLCVTDDILPVGGRFS